MPLPDVLLPYAERLFLWFPEVLVSLGHPSLQDLFEIPPMPGAEMKIEESGEYKVVQVRLRRRARKTPQHPAQGRAAQRNRAGGSTSSGPSASSPEQPCDQSLSPFSKSRQILQARNSGNPVQNAGGSATAPSSKASLRFAPPLRQDYGPPPPVRPSSNFVEMLAFGPHRQMPAVPASCNGNAVSDAQVDSGLDDGGSPVRRRSSKQPPPLSATVGAVAPATGGDGADEDNVPLSPLTPNSAFDYTSERLRSRTATENGATQANASGEAPSPVSGGTASVDPIQSSDIQAGRGPSSTQQSLAAWEDVPPKAPAVAAPVPLPDKGRPPAGPQDAAALGEAATRPREYASFSASPAGPDSAASAGTLSSVSSMSSGRARGQRYSSPTTSGGAAGTTPEGSRTPSPSQERVTASSESAPAVNVIPTAAGPPPRAARTPGLRSGGSADPGSPKFASPGSHDPWNNLDRESKPRRPGSVNSFTTDSDQSERERPGSFDSKQPSLSGESGADREDTGRIPSTSTCTSSEANPKKNRVKDRSKFVSAPPGGLRDEPLEGNAESGGQTDSVPRSPISGQADQSGAPRFLWSNRAPAVAGNRPPLARGPAWGSMDSDSSTGPAPGASNPGMSLKERRKMQLQTPFAQRSSGPVSSQDRPRAQSSSAVHQGLLPAVMKTEPSGSKASERPLPGAFPMSRTLIVFDWDDTLCPTSWIRSILKAHLAESEEWAFDNDVESEWRHQIPAWFGQPLPDEPQVRESIDELQRAVIDVINAAQRLGIVCIITNADPRVGWVEKTMKKWLPKLTQYILGHAQQPSIQVLYGQREYEMPHPKLKDLGWVDDLGELMWWKKAAMSTVLRKVDELYRVADPLPADDAVGAKVSWLDDCSAKDLVNFISIGDSNAEIQSAYIAALFTGPDRRDESTGGNKSSTRVAGGQRRPLSAPAGSRLPNRPWVKTLKLWEGPDVEQIVEQLDLLKNHLSQLVAARQHMHLYPEDLPYLRSAGDQVGRRAENEMEERLHLQLRTQTV